MTFKIRCPVAKCNHPYALDGDRWKRYAGKKIRCKHCGGGMPVPLYEPHRLRYCQRCGDAFLQYKDSETACPDCRRRPAHTSVSPVPVAAKTSAGTSPAAAVAVAPSRPESKPPARPKRHKVRPKKPRRRKDEKTFEPPKETESIAIDFRTYMDAFARSLDLRRWTACWLTTAVVICAGFVVVQILARVQSVQALGIGTLTFLLFFLISAGVLAGVISTIACSEQRDNRRLTLGEASARVFQRFGHYGSVFVLAALLALFVGLLLLAIFAYLEGLRDVPAVISVLFILSRIVIVAVYALLLVGCFLLPSLIAVSGKSVFWALRWYFTAALKSCPGRLYASSALLLTLCGLLCSPLISVALVGATLDGAVSIWETLKRLLTSESVTELTSLADNWDPKVWAFIIAFLAFQAIPVSFVITGATYVSDRLTQEHPLR